MNDRRDRQPWAPDLKEAELEAQALPPELRPGGGDLPDKNSGQARAPRLTLQTQSGGRRGARPRGCPGEHRGQGAYTLVCHSPGRWVSRLSPQSGSWSEPVPRPPSLRPLTVCPGRARSEQRGIRLSLPLFTETAPSRTYRLPEISLLTPPHHGEGFRVGTWGPASPLHSTCTPTVSAHADGRLPEISDSPAPIPPPQVTVCLNVDTSPQA